MLADEVQSRYFKAQCQGGCSNMDFFKLVFLFEITSYKTEKKQDSQMKSFLNKSYSNILTREDQPQS